MLQTQNETTNEAQNTDTELNFDPTRHFNAARDFLVIDNQTYLRVKNPRTGNVCSSLFYLEKLDGSNLRHLVKVVDPSTGDVLDVVVSVRLHCEVLGVTPNITKKSKHK